MKAQRLGQRQTRRSRCSLRLHHSSRHPWASQQAALLARLPAAANWTSGSHHPSRLNRTYHHLVSLRKLVVPLHPAVGTLLGGSSLRRRLFRKVMLLAAGPLVLAVATAAAAAAAVATMAAPVATPGRGSALRQQRV